MLLPDTFLTSDRLKVMFTARTGSSPRTGGTFSLWSFKDFWGWSYDAFTWKVPSVCSVGCCWHWSFRQEWAGGGQSTVVLVRMWFKAKDWSLGYSFRVKPSPNSLFLKCINWDHYGCKSESFSAQFLHLPSLASTDDCQLYCYYSSLAGSKLTWRCSCRREGTRQKVVPKCCLTDHTRWSWKAYRTEKTQSHLMM